MAKFHEGEAAESLRRQARELLARAAALAAGTDDPAPPPPRRNRDLSESR